MSDQNTQQPEEPVAPTPSDAEASDESLESVSGGIIDGGCIPKIPGLPGPTFPDPGGCFPQYPIITTWG